MTRFYRLANNDEDLPDDGLLAVTMQEPYEKPRIRLVPIALDEDAARAFADDLGHPMTKASSRTWPLY